MEKVITCKQGRNFHFITCPISGTHVHNIASCDDEKRRIIGR